MLKHCSSIFKEEGKSQAKPSWGEHRRTKNREAIGQLVNAPLTLNGIGHQTVNKKKEIAILWFLMPRLAVSSNSRAKRNSFRTGLSKLTSKPSHTTATAQEQKDKNWSKKSDLEIYPRHRDQRPVHPMSSRCSRRIWRRLLSKTEGKFFCSIQPWTSPLTAFVNSIAQHQVGSISKLFTI